MIRRSFRIGLTLGLLGGLAFALVKMFGGRSEHQADHSPVPTEPWPRLVPDPVAPPVVAPAPPPAQPAPVAPVVTAPAPAVEAPTPAPAPAPPPAPEPVPDVEKVAAATPAAPKKAAKKAAPKKSATKKAAKKAASTAPAAKKSATKKGATKLWVTPTDDVCPTSHPVKAKLTSKIFHLPGMLNYERTKPDRCYRDGPAAESDGLRPAKR